MTPEQQRIAIAEWCGLLRNRDTTIIKRNENGADPSCPACHGTGWDGDGYTLCCAVCSPSIMDLHVDKTCERVRTIDGRLIYGEVIIPDYLGDLNAIHEAEKNIDQELYVAQLLAVIHEVDSDYFHKISWKNGYELTTATAAQRCEALLRTIGKWQDQQKAPTEAGA